MVARREGERQAPTDFPNTDIAQSTTDSLGELVPEAQTVAMAAIPRRPPPQAAVAIETATTTVDAEPPTHEEGWIGQHLAQRYRIERLLGSGSTGNVYEAEHLTVGTKVAVKVLSVSGVDARMLNARFEREAQVLAKLQSPHTLRFLDFGHHEDTPYLVTEILKGQALDALVQDGRQLTSIKTARVLRQTCLALSEAHAAGVVHRDLKPANIYVTQLAGKDHVKVIDFGIAKLVEGAGKQLTLEGFALGTPNYMSPEQATAKRVSAASDFYSLGAVAYHCLAGKPPFEGSAMQLVHHHIQTEPTDVLVHAPGADPELAQLIMKMLAKAPEDRPQTADDLLTVLNRIVLAEDARASGVFAAQPTPTAQSKAAIEPTPVGQRTPPWRTVVVAVVLLVAAGLAAFALTSGT